MEDNKYNFKKEFIEKFKKENIAVHCETQEEANEFCEIMNELSGTDDFAPTDWDNVGRDMCYRQRGSYSSKTYYLSKGYEVIKFSDLVQEEQKKYKTKDIDYTGCAPVIAEHLKRGESILCNVECSQKETLKSAFIRGYTSKSGGLYLTSFGKLCESATPRPQQIQYVKKASEIMAWLEDNGWGCNGYGDYYKDYCDNSTTGFMATMHQFCGKKLPNSSDKFLPEWLEYK